MEYLSTTSLANELDMPSNELFAKFKSYGWVDRKADKWVLTEAGKQKGGQIKNHPKFGDYIVWPENLSIENTTGSKPKLLNATAIGSHFKVSNKRLNLILSELGWMEKTIAGWAVTNIGRSIGGKQFESDTNGTTYVLWPESILKNESLKGSFEEENEIKEVPKLEASSENGSVGKINNFREKFEAKHRTKDGHYVRSRAEMLIDNALYDYGLVHAYEKKLSIEEEVYTDFYLPNGKVYIEFWGVGERSQIPGKKEKEA